MNRFKNLYLARAAEEGGYNHGGFPEWMGIGRDGLEWNGRGQLRFSPPLIVVVVPNCRPEFDLGKTCIWTSMIEILHSFCASLITK